MTNTSWARGPVHLNQPGSVCRKHVWGQGPPGWVRDTGWSHMVLLKCRGALGDNARFCGRGRVPETLLWPGAPHPPGRLGVKHPESQPLTSGCGPGRKSLGKAAIVCRGAGGRSGSTPCLSLPVCAQAVCARGFPAPVSRFRSDLLYSVVSASDQGVCLRMGGDTCQPSGQSG